MKKISFLFFTIVSVTTYAQEHFAGISTSSRVSILNAGVNPAEITNTATKFEINTLATSFSITNNKIGYNDIISGKNLEELIFKGTDPINLRLTTEVYGPSFIMKNNKWAFGISTKANAKLDLIDVDVQLGDAIKNGGVNGLIGSTTLNNNYNQRISGITWGEVGLTAARNIYTTTRHKLSAGATFKLLFPGSYANFGIDKFQGTVTYNLGQAYLNNTNANLNVAYSGGLATNFSDYSTLFGKLNGLASDIGINYQWKEEANTSSKNKYNINAGLSVRNIGAMTFSNENNSIKSYNLSIPPPTLFNQGLNLNQFESANNLQEIETILQNSGYLTTTKSSKDFKVKLPTLFSAYADVKIIPSLFVTAYVQQKLNDDTTNGQITSQNLVTLTPRFTSGIYEVYSSWTSSEIAGLNGGFGFRIGGFYLGSSSIVTALLSDSKQADIYLGFNLGIL